MVRPKAAILTLYGDYVLPRGGEIGIGSLVILLSNFGLSEQAVRSAVSRMCQAGLLKGRQEERKSYYSLTESGHSLLTKGTQRIFVRKNNQWDGSWSIVIYSIPERRREARDRLRLELSWMGYGPLSEATWISPYDMTKEVEDLAERLQIKEHVQMFQARHQSCTDPKEIVSRCWDLGRIHKRYANFVDKYRPKLEYHLKRLEAGENIESSECFVERFNLIHEYRKFPFLDPDLPRELLPENWLRPQAAALFDEYHDLLADKANEYFDSVSDNYRGTRRALAGVNK
ncbi:MAG: PaaX family transcriptional regulator C-terminal domain-containing protein [Dehalococcoidia bacterium]